MRPGKVTLQQKEAHCASSPSMTLSHQRDCQASSHFTRIYGPCSKHKSDGQSVLVTLLLFANDLLSWATQTVLRCLLFISTLAPSTMASQRRPSQWPDEEVQFIVCLESLDRTHCPRDCRALQRPLSGSAYAFFYVKPLSVEA